MPNSTSRVLLLIICSNTKTREGESAHAPAGGLTLGVLNGQPADQLFANRERIRTLVKDDSQLSRIPYNKSLSSGPDFTLRGGKAAGLYLPAARRYRGRFYEKLDPDGASLLMSSKHHVLIVSGLYGLLTPNEQIQCYSCNVNDRDEIARWWTEGDNLSRALVSYMKKFDIRKVFDFMAVNAYRRLINWQVIRHETSADVLHAFSNQLVGDALLFPFGVVAKSFLGAPENELVSKQPGDYEKVPEYGVEVEFERGIEPQSLHLRREPEPPSAPVIGTLTPEDLIVRMRLNLGLMVDKLSHLRGQDDKFPQRVDALVERHVVPGDCGKGMKTINAWRNLVLHEYTTIPALEWQELKDDYARIDQWSRAQPNLAELPLRPIHP